MEKSYPDIDRKNGGKMDSKPFQKVSSANGTTQAISLQNALENAGIPVTIAISRDGDYLDVLVPAHCVYDAEHLLAPEPRSGEIYFVPAHA
jgi:hypothetical protein